MNKKEETICIYLDGLLFNINFVYKIFGGANAATQHRFHVVRFFFLILSSNSCDL